jgi:hypothetical protein
MVTAGGIEAEARPTPVAASPLDLTRNPLEAALGRLVRFFGGEASAVSYTILASLFVFLKVLVASRFDTTTAAALLEATGIFAIVTGALALSMPYMSGLIFFLALAPYEVRGDTVWSPTWTRALRGLALTTRIVGLVLAVTAVPWPMVLVGALALFVMRGRQLPLASVVVLGVVTVVVLMLISDRLWIPVERVTLAADVNPCETTESECTAFVVDDQAPWATLLLYEPRKIVRVPAESIAARAVCRVDPAHTQSLYMLAQPLIPSAPRWWGADC